MLENIMSIVVKKISGQPEMVSTPRILQPREFEDVIAVRNGNLGLQRRTNISWVLGDWNPEAGFEWGYLGQGPRDFARNILMHFSMDEEFCFEHEIEFLEKFVSQLPREGGRIKKQQILKFIADKKAA